MRRWLAGLLVGVVLAFGGVALALQDSAGADYSNTNPVPVTVRDPSGLSTACILDLSVVPTKITGSSAGTATATLAAGRYRLSVVGGETAKLRYAPPTSCAANPATDSYGGLVVGTQDPAYFAVSTVVCVYSATSAALVEFQACK